MDTSYKNLTAHENPQGHKLKEPSNKSKITAPHYKVTVSNHLSSFDQGQIEGAKGLNLYSLIKEDYFGEPPLRVRPVYNIIYDTRDKAKEGSQKKLTEKFRSILTTGNQFRIRNLTSLVGDDGKEYSDHWTLNYCAGGEDIEGVLVFNNGILTFNQTHSIEPLPKPSKKSKNGFRKVLGSLQSIINVRDIIEYKLMTFPIPCSKHCHKNDNVHILQLTLCSHGGFAFDQQFEETINKLQAQRKPYTSVYFNIKPECGNTSMNKESIKALTQLQGRIQSSIQAISPDFDKIRDKSSQKTSLPYFELLTKSFPLEQADLLHLSKQLIKSNFETLLAQSKEQINLTSSASLKIKEPCSQIVKKQKKVITPNTTDQSTVASSNQFGQIMACVPDLYQMLEWKLLYSTVQHGTSYNNLLRRASSANPFLIIATDFDGNVFGAYGSAKLKFSEDYYGTPETFLFAFKKTNDIQDFQWSKKNDLFIFTSDAGIMFGAGPFYGLWIGNELTRGRTHSCDTFDNELLADSNDFQIAKLEVWGVSDPLRRLDCLSFSRFLLS